MPLPDLNQVITSALVVTGSVRTFPELLSATLIAPAQRRTHHVILHNQDETAIPIDLVRSLKTTTAYSLGKSELQEIVLLWADLLTVPAQHALLKLLEEPPAQTRIWLVTDKPQSLLETIGSRCVRLTIPDSEATALQPTLPKKMQSVTIELLQTQNHSQLISLAALPKDRVEAVAWCNSMLVLSHKDQEFNATKTQQLLLTAIEQLQQNANVKLVLEDCFFQIKQK